MRRTTWKFHSHFLSCAGKAWGSKKKYVPWCSHFRKKTKTIQYYTLMRSTPYSDPWLCCYTLSDMPGQGHNLEVDDDVPRRLRSEGAMKDVFAMVKGYMSDQSLIQPPLLCYPASFAASTENYFNQINSTREVVHQELEAERIAELESLAAAISKDFPHMDRAVRYYRTVIDMARPRKPFSRLSFLDAGPFQRNGLGNVQLPQRPAEPMNHWLQVVFHHSRG